LKDQNVTDKFNLIIKTPEKETFSGEVDNIYITTDVGDTEIHPFHASLGAVVSYSPIIITISENRQIEYIIKRGVLFFSNEKNEALLVAYSAQKREEIDFESAKEYLKFVNEKLKSKDDDSLGDFTLKFLEDERIALVREFDLD